MYNLIAALSTGAAATTTGGTGAGAGVGSVMSAGSASAAISPAAGFGIHGVPFNERREELEILSFQLWTSPHVLRFVHSTWRHDQHLLAALIPMNVPSCHLGSNFACLA